MAKKKKVAFKALKKLTPPKRKEVAQSPAGQTMLSALTPTEFALLFPKYYQQGLPDVGGFQRAITKQTQEQREKYDEEVSKKLGITSPAAAERARREGRTPDTGGGSITSSGNLAANQREAYKAAIAEGLSPAAAKILVANMSGESLRNPADHHWDRSHMSQGIVQWDPGRAERIKAQFGAYPKDMSVAQQTKAAIWEMKTYYKSAYNDLTNESLGNRDRMYGVVSKYEIPQDKDGATDLRMKHLTGLRIDESPIREGATPSATGGTTSNMVGKAFVNAKGKTECVTYAQQAGGVGHTSRWSPGTSAKDGSLKSGDWIATFGSGGKYTNTYGESHVARFESYIYDDSGKIVGMNVTHQYNKSGEVIPGKFMFGSGGEFDASRYHQIVDNGNPASMSVSDATDGKIEERKRYTLEHPEQDDSNQVSSTEAKTQVEVTQQRTDIPPPPHPSSSSPEQKLAETTKTTATVEKPKPEPVRYKFNEAAFIKEVRAKETGAMFVSDEYIMGETVKGFQTTPGVKYDRKSGTITIEDPNSPAIQTIINDMKSHGFDQGKFLNKQDGKQSAIEPKQQTATVGQKLQKEFGIASAVAGENNADVWAREEAYRKKHPYGPEMPVLQGPEMPPEVQATTKGADANSMRSKVEKYYGQKISDHEYDMLIRATHAESSAKRHVPEEHAMIMGTILNRAKSNKNGITGALMARYQFESVTGRTKGQFSPNPAYKAGPSDRRMSSINESVMNYLDRVPSNQKYFTSEKGDKSSWHKKVASMEGNAVYGGTRFGKGLMPEQKPTEVAAVQQQIQAPPPTPTPQAPEQKPTVTEQVKKVAQEAVGVKPAEAAETPKAPAPTVTPAPSAPAAPPPPQAGKPDESSQQSFLQSQGIGKAEPVPAKAEGGKVKTKGNVSAYPIGGLRGDNTVAVDTKTQKPLFTFNPQKEAVVPTGENNRADVVPTRKAGAVGPENRPNIHGELSKLRQEMGSMVINAAQSKETVKQPAAPARDINSIDFINSKLHSTDKPFFNPTMHRAISRAKGGVETGDAIDGNHYSSGTKTFT